MAKSRNGLHVKSRGHDYNQKTNIISPPAKKKGGEKISSEAHQIALEETKKKAINGSETIPQSSPLEMHREAIAYLLHHIDELRITVKDHTKLINQLTEKIYENETF